MKKINYILLFIYLLLSLSISVSAQNGIVKGRVYDYINNEPLPFVNVIVSGTAIVAVSDIDGNFSITGLQNGFVQLRATSVGYESTQSDEIQVTNAKVAYVEIAMQQSTKNLQEVVVTANSNRTREESPVSLQTLGLSEIEGNPGSNRDITKVIQSLPGVGSAPTFRNDVIIRGGGPTESRFYLDGVEIPYLNHFSTQGSSGGVVGIINADFISSVNYYSGAFPANRGNALSGVFEFSQVDGNKDRAKFRASLGASEVSLTADGPLGKRSTFVFSVRQSYLQFLFSALGLPFLPTYNDYQFKNRTRINDKSELTIISIGALDRNKLNTGIENPDESQRYILRYLPVNNQWNYALGAVYKHFSKNGYQTYVLSRNMLNNTAFKYPDNDESKLKTLDYKSQEMENKFRAEQVERFGTWKLLSGVSLEYAKYNNSTKQKLFAGGQLIDIDYYSDIEMFKYGVFAQASKMLFNESLTLSLGFRSDWNNFSKSMKNPVNQLSPRFSASYSLTDNLKLNFNTGKYYQLPSYLTLGYRNSQGTLVNKENDLKYIAANHYIAGIEYIPQNDLSFNTEIFYKTYANYPFSLKDSITLANKGADFAAVGDEPVKSTGEGHAYGFEFTTRWKTANNFTMYLSYTYVRSEFKDKNGDWNPSAWDSRNLLTLMTSKKFQGNWTLGAKWRLLGGLPYTPYDTTNSALVNVWDSQGRAYLDYNRLNSNRLSTLQQLDVRLDKKYYFRTWSLMMYIDIQNLYASKTPQPDEFINVYDTDGNALYTDATKTKYQLKALNTGSGTVLPTIGIMIEF